MSIDRYRDDAGSLKFDLMPFLHEAQGGICPGCGQPIYMDVYKNRPFGCTIDHCIPLSRNGADLVGNLLAMHKRCNEHKGNRMPTGCEIIFLIAVNSRLGVGPQKW